MDDFDNFDRNFNRMFKLVSAFIATVFALIVLYFIFFIFIGVKGCNSVKENGLKDTMEQVWNGPTRTTNGLTYPVEVE